MTDILAVFRSKTQAADCRARLAAHAVNARLVSTPVEIKTGCGLSVQFSAYQLKRVKSHILRGQYSTFCGFAFAGRSGRYYLNKVL